MMNNFEMHHRTLVRPRRVVSGKVAFAVPKSYVRNKHELALTISFMVHRKLFGAAYAGLQPDYFYNMPADSGVYACPIIPSQLLSEGTTFPGDIDLLVLPYEKDSLILHRILAMEIKIVRASYARQGKSPNGFGISQAEGLLAMGFPYAVVAHLIVSDESPRATWREVGIARVIGPNGLVELMPPQHIDWMPINLMRRAIGRLEAFSSQATIGMVAAYLGGSDEEVFGNRLSSMFWYPHCRRALPNPRLSMKLLQNVVGFFESRPSCFLDNPRYGPA